MSRLRRFTRSAPHVLAGAVAFAAAQAFLFLAAGEATRPTIDGRGWFLNSGTGIILMAVVAATVCAAVLRARPASPILKGSIAFVVGAGVALTTTVFALGPGTIFPIVIAAGFFVVVVAAVAGSSVASLLRRERMR